MKHAQSTGSGRVYDEKTHQWVEASEAPKAARRAKARPEPQVDSAAAQAVGAGETNPQSAEE